MSDKRGINWKKPTTWMILGFIVLLIFMLSREGRAETSIELAPESTFIAGHIQQGSALFFTERFAGKYDIGIALATALSCREDGCTRPDSPTNQGVYVQRVVTYHRLELGLGISYWHNTTAAWSSHTPFALHLAWNLNDSWRLRWRHFSTGGSSEKNAGWDLLTIDYRPGAQH